MTYASRLITGTLTVLFITVVVLVIGVDRSLRSDLEAEAQAALEREAALVRDALPADSTQWNAAVVKAAEATGLRVTVVDPSGRVRAESDVVEAEIGRIENHASRPEFGQALAGRVGADRRTSATVGKRFMYVAIPGGPGAVRVARSLDQVDQIVRRAQRPVAVAGLVALLLGIPLAILAARRFARPLVEIAHSARQIAQGEPPQFPFSGIPDIDRLTGDLRSMHQQLVERFETLRRKQSETSAIVDSMIEGVLSSDARGRITTANPAARRLLGYGEHDALPELPLLVRGREAREAVLKVLEGAPVSDKEIQFGDRTYLLNARPLPVGGAVVVLHDLTHLRRLETVRRDFVANVSHELKTPLTAISGYTETLLAERPEPEIERRFLETILSNARRMQRLVDDQLDLSRIESGAWSPSPERVAVEPAAREAWALAVPRTDRVGTGRTRTPQQDGLPRFEVEVAPGADFLAADPDAVRQIFRNLFENAIRHTPPSGSISVRARGEDGGIRLTVADTGTGIPSEHLTRVFERFYRVDPSRSREQGGTGLGLAIVKHLVESHGGRAWAESGLGQGTSIHTFWPNSPPKASA